MTKFLLIFCVQFITSYAFLILLLITSWYFVLRKDSALRKSENYSLAVVLAILAIVFFTLKLSSTFPSEFNGLVMLFDIEASGNPSFLLLVKLSEIFLSWLFAGLIYLKKEKLNNLQKISYSSLILSLLVYGVSIIIKLDTSLFSKSYLLVIFYYILQFTSVTFLGYWVYHLIKVNPRGRALFNVLLICSLLSIVIVLPSVVAAFVAINPKVNEEINKQESLVRHLIEEESQEELSVAISKVNYISEFKIQIVENPSDLNNSFYTTRVIPPSDGNDKMVVIGVPYDYILSILFVPMRDWIYLVLFYNFLIHILIFNLKIFKDKI